MNLLHLILWIVLEICLCVDLRKEIMKRKSKQNFSKFRMCVSAMGIVCMTYSIIAELVQ